MGNPTGMGCTRILTMEHKRASVLDEWQSRVLCDTFRQYTYKGEYKGLHVINTDTHIIEISVDFHEYAAED